VRFLVVSLLAITTNPTKKIKLRPPSFVKASSWSPVSIAAADRDHSAAQRLPSLDGLRGAAAFAVMLYHFGICFVPQGKLFAVPFLARAYLAVDLFFLLSGFVMAHVYGVALAADRAGAWPLFARARFARIYPLFALTLAATVADIALFSARPPFVAFSGESLMLQPLLLQQWWPTGNWNYPTWSISTEVEAYVLFVFAARLLLTGRYPRTIAAGCVATVVGLSFAGGGNLNLFFGMAALARTLAEFALGVLIFRAHKRGVPLLRQWSGVLALVFAGLGLLTHQDCLVVVGLACLILYSVGATDLFGRILNCRPAILLGNWSYGVYLWHAPVHMAIMGVLAAHRVPIGSLNPSIATLLALAAAVLVIGLSAVSYGYFERPIRRVLMAPPAQTDSRN
jgi:peptidoglycan/LPS O-acetylase OafA/YrhL